MVEHIPKKIRTSECKAGFTGRARNADKRQYYQRIDCELRKRGLCPNGDNLPFEVEGEICTAETTKEFNSQVAEADSDSLMRVQDMCDQVKRDMLN